MKTGGLISAATPRKRRLLSSTCGSMTIPGLIFFTALMAVGGLAIDMQRLYGVHGQMQAFVDDAALAGAAELDGQTGAITRAVRAACGTSCGASTGPLVSGTQQFADGPAALGVRKLTFLSELSADPGPLGVTPTPTEVMNNWVLCTYDNGNWAPANCDADAAINRDSKFVEVVAEPRTVSYIVLPIADVISAMAGGAPITSQATLQLRATAGYKRKICDIHPMMICNPSEPVGNLNTAYPYTPIIGQQILLKASGNGFWGPGDFGLLSVPNDAGGICNGNGAGALNCILGLVDPLTQCIDDEVTVKPGQAEVTRTGLNVRFDIYDGPMNGKRNGPDAPLFAPSVNVIKALCNADKSGNCQYNGGNACNPINPPPAMYPTMPLPRDSNIQADMTGTVRFGNANWNRAGYWAVNHPLDGPWPPAGLSANATRYQVYRWEIENARIPNVTPNGERGSPACSSAPGVNRPSRDRRLLTTAVINCRAANGGTGIQGMNNGTNLPVVAYLQMFLTEPVGLQIDHTTGMSLGDNNMIHDVYGEVAGVANPNNNNEIYHVYPVLFR